MTGFKSKKAAAQELTLQEQLDKAKADLDKAESDSGKANEDLHKASADWRKANKSWEKTRADWRKADEEIKRIKTLMDKETTQLEQPAQPAAAAKEYTMGDWFNDLEHPHGNR